MSAKLVGRALEVQGLDPIEKLTLIALADVSNAMTGACWPSRAWLSEVIERSPRQISRYIRALEKRGFVKMTARPGTSNSYEIFPDPNDGTLDTDDKTPMTPVTPHPGHGVDTSVSRGVDTSMSTEPEGTYRTAPRCESCGHVSFAGHRCQAVAS